MNVFFLYVMRCAITICFYYLYIAVHLQSFNMIQVLVGKKKIGGAIGIVNKFTVLFIFHVLLYALFIIIDAMLKISV